MAMTAQSNTDSDITISTTHFLATWQRLGEVIAAEMAAQEDDCWANIVLSKSDGSEFSSFVVFETDEDIGNELI